MDFALILFLLSIATGLLWAYDVMVARKKRALHDPAPWWVEYGASFFPVILPIFLLRSFWVEPFRIPSGSMIPTLLVGDFILVNKYDYGVRLPVINKKIIEVGNPKRGDVMVFRYPNDPSQDYIKRVVGLPGDKIEYIQKRLTINGKPVDEKASGDYFHPDRLYYSQRFDEQLGEKHHSILNDKDAPPLHSGDAALGSQIRVQLPALDRRGGVYGAGGPLFHDGGQPRPERRLSRVGLCA